MVLAYKKENCTLVPQSKQASERVTGIKVDSLFIRLSISRLSPKSVCATVPSGLTRNLKKGRRLSSEC